MTIFQGLRLQPAAIIREFKKEFQNLTKNDDFSVAAHATRNRYSRIQKGILKFDSQYIYFFPVMWGWNIAHLLAGIPSTPFRCGGPGSHAHGTFKIRQRYFDSNHLPILSGTPILAVFDRTKPTMLKGRGRR